MSMGAKEFRLGACAAALFGAALLGGPAAARAVDYKREAGPYPVVVGRGAWTDAARDRRVPYKFYLPFDLPDPAPVVLYSHELGGSREDAEYLGRHLASWGYVAVHLQHPGSDAEVWSQEGEHTEAEGRVVMDLRNAMDRFRDVAFVLDRLAEANRTEKVLQGRLDLGRVAIAGHSYGATTALVAAGQRLGPELTLRDPRIRAAIAMSPSAPQGARDLDRAFSEVKIPILHVTGTGDDSPLRALDPKERRVPFDHIHGADQYLLILKGGDHMVFSGHRVGGDWSGDAAAHELICMASMAFLDAYLKDDAKARQWLAGGGFAAALGDAGTFEVHRAGAGH
jgi:predicted dienelactone hydrolase